jgi:terpene synthase-like protein
MKHEPLVHASALPMLERVRPEYSELLRSPATSLQQLFESDHFQFAHLGKDLRPHPESKELQLIAETFGRQYGIWLDNAKHYITCTLFLYPMASFDRMAAIVKNNAVDYYLNDTMGRDVFGLLSPGKQTVAKKVVQRMSALDDRLYVPPTAHAVEKANAEVLTFIRDTSPRSWFEEFLYFYSHHLAVTHQDLNSSSLGHVSSVPEYIHGRNHTAGMHHIMLLIQYSLDNFLDWQHLGTTGLAYPLRRMQEIVTTFGALSNDLFSFEKEVIDNNAESNLVSNMLLNDPALSLHDALMEAAGIIRNMLIEYTGLRTLLTAKLDAYADAGTKRQLKTHLAGLEICLQASWLWQVYTKRYKRISSIWTETTLPR